VNFIEHYSILFRFFWVYSCYLSVPLEPVIYMLRFGSRPLTDLCYLSLWIFLEFWAFYWRLYVNKFAFFGVFFQCDFILWLIMWYPSHVFEEKYTEKHDFAIMWSITSAFNFILFRFFYYFCAIWVYHRNQWLFPLVLAVDHQLIYVMYLYE
jgi:hypothetical protein